MEARFPRSRKGKKIANVFGMISPRYEYITKGDEYKIAVNMEAIANEAKEEGVKDTWTITLVIKYPVRAK